MYAIIISTNVKLGLKIRIEGKCNFYGNQNTNRSKIK